MDNLNPPTVIIESNVVGLNESVRLDSLLIVNDADQGSAITEYQIRDNTNGGGYFTQNGTPLDPAYGSFHVIPANQIGTIQYVGGNSIGTDSITVRAYDGQFWSNSATGLITSGNSRPVLTANNVALDAGSTVSIADLVAYSDAENNQDRLYYIVDRKIGANGGQLIQSQDEIVNPQGNWLLVSNFELAGTTYEVPTLPGDSETLSIRAFDGFSWSEVVDFTITASSKPAVIDNGPQEVATNERRLASELFSLDAAVEAVTPIQSYLFVDRRPNATGGYFEFKGVRQASAEWFSVSADELNQLEYVGASVENDLENIGIMAFNGFQFGDVQEIEILTVSAPDVSASNQSVRAGHYLNFGTGGTATSSGTLPASNTPVFEFNNVSDGSIKEFLFVDRLIDGGYFVFKGDRVNSASWFRVPFDELDQLEYVGAQRAPNSEEIGVMVNTNFVWNELGDFTIDTIPVDLTLDTIERIEVSNLFTQTDQNSSLARYQIFDENLDTRSGRFELDGVDLEIGVVHELNIDDYSRLVFKGAEVDLGRQLDPIIARFNNGSDGWSEWERVNLNTDPVGQESLISGTQVADKDTPDLSVGITEAISQAKTVITYSFTDGGNQGGDGGGARTQVPDYYDPASNEAIADAFNLEKAFSREQREAFREVFDVVEHSSNLQFVELPYTRVDTQAEIVIGALDMTGFAAGAAAYAYYPSSGDGVGNIQSDIWFNWASGDLDPDQDGTMVDADGNPIPATDVSLGGFFRFVAFHELGHALGLAHPFDESVVPLSIFNNFDYLTVMAYQHDSVHNPYNPYLNAAGETDYSASWSLYDIQQVQSLYGVNTDYNSGSNQYGNFYSGAPYFVDNNEQHQTTLWDAGGNDTLNYTLHVANETMDLREGTYSSVNGVPRTLRISYNTVIENARGGSGNDNIRGNEIKNFLIGNAGDDVLRGGGDNDVVRGGAGDDTYIWTLGDGRDLVQELSEDGLDTLEVYDPSGQLTSLEDDLTFRRFGNDLRIDFTFNQGSGQGTVTIDDFGDQTSRVEFLTIHNASGTQIGQKIDLQSIYDQATTLHQQFAVTTTLATTLPVAPGAVDENAFTALAVS